MKELTIKAFTFDELSPTAKAKARDWWREGQFDDTLWSEATIDEVVEQGNLMGIDFEERIRLGSTGNPLPGEPCIWWTGFSSQGDGACFEGTWRASAVQADKVAAGWGEDPATTEIKRIAAEFSRIATAYHEASFFVNHSGHYYHEHCTDFTFDFPDGDEGADWPENKRLECEKECDALQKNAKDFMRWIYRRLEKEYEYQRSDESVDESIATNEYLFTEEGERSVILK